MRLVTTIDTIHFAPGEEWEPTGGCRIIPETLIDRDALAQIWASQHCRPWPLDGREIPYDRAHFSSALEWTVNGFATTEVYLTTDQPDPFTALKSVQDAPKITVFWIWEQGRIQAYWSASAAPYNSPQANQAQYNIVFR